MGFFVDAFLYKNDLSSYRSSLSLLLYVSSGVNLCCWLMLCQTPGTYDVSYVTILQAVVVFVYSDEVSTAVISCRS